MAEHNELGKLGEELAVDFLVQNGYQILERNWRFQKAEIDILASKNEILAVVEVKTRSSADFGLPQDFVNSKKIKQLLSAVNSYVSDREIDFEIRFDIVAVLKTTESTSIEHIEDAFFYF
ncbi:YraN family protein [Flavobacterium agrisoli]|uniref:UPF0102 protein I5M07_06035 n=1 Tax=Flavobacterium agrisoli TaxID=2793066 RepID=A0A934PM74_9FLAO|nr:YraN family protein [Flavobacterium agrisoli]MBK0369395.1 YraN family protein [Flavobacterium agrisoli]